MSELKVHKPCTAIPSALVVIYILYLCVSVCARAGVCACVPVRTHMCVHVRVCRLMCVLIDYLNSDNKPSSL